MGLFDPDILLRKISFLFINFCRFYLGDYRYIFPSYLLVLIIIPISLICQSSSKYTTCSSK